MKDRLGSLGEGGGGGLQNVMADVKQNYLHLTTSHEGSDEAHTLVAALGKMRKVTFKKDAHAY